MNAKRDCQSCKCCKDGYCAILELEPHYHNVGCDDKEFERSIITRVGILDDNFWRTLELKHPLDAWRNKNDN